MNRPQFLFEHTANNYDKNYRFGFILNFSNAASIVTRANPVISYTGTVRRRRAVGATIKTLPKQSPRRAVYATRRTKAAATSICIGFIRGIIPEAVCRADTVIQIALAACKIAGSAHIDAAAAGTNLRTALI